MKRFLNSLAFFLTSILISLTTTSLANAQVGDTFPPGFHEDHTTGVTKTNVMENTHHRIVDEPPQPPLIFGSVDSSLSLALDPRVRQELNLLDDQLQDFQHLRIEFEKKLSERLARDMNPQNRGILRMNKIKNDVTDEYRTRLNEILLPPQIERLNQINAQHQLRRRGILKTLLNDSLFESLKIDVDQRETLIERAQNIQEKLQRDVEQLKADADKELLSTLTKSQREEFELILGREFQLKPLNETNGQ